MRRLHTLQAILLVALSVAALAIVAGAARADTTVPGQTLGSDATWSLAGSPYVVTGQVHVTSGATLTIEPGVEVRFGTSGNLHFGQWNAAGRLVANGTAAEPILLTSAASTKARGDWGYLRFEGPAPAGGSWISNATIEYAGRSSNSAVQAFAHGLTVSDVTIRESAWAAVHASNANPVLRNVLVDNVTQWGVYAETNARPTLDGVHLQRTGNAPFRLRLDHDVSGVTVSQPATAYVEWHGVDLVANRTTTHVTDDATGARLVHRILSSFTVHNGATWTIPPGSEVHFAQYVQAQIGTYSCCGNTAGRGSLLAEGTQAEPITFRGVSGTAATGWYGFYFYGYQYPGTSVLRNVTVSHSRDDGVEAYQYPSLTLDNATLRDHGRWGLYFHGASHATVRNLLVNGTGADGVRITDSSPRLDEVRIESVGGYGVGAGNSGFTLTSAFIDRPAKEGVYLYGCGVATLRDVTVERSVGYGVLADGNCNGLHLEDVRLWNATGRPWRNRVDMTYDVQFSNAGILQIEYTGATLSRNWTMPVHHREDGAKYVNVLLGRVEVRGDATLTIPPDTTLLVAQNVEIQVGAYSCCGNPSGRGHLVAEGTQAQPIEIRALTNATATGWHGFHFYGYQYPGTSVVRNATIAQSKDDAVEAYYYPGLALDNVTLERPGRFGLYLHGGSHATARNLVVNGSGSDGLHFYDSSPRLTGVRVLNATHQGVWAVNSAYNLTDGYVHGAGYSGFYHGGCGVATLNDVVIDDPAGYGLYADGSCNGLHLHGVDVLSPGSRPWRNRIDVDYDDVVVQDAGVLDLEYLGADLTRNRTLPLHVNGSGVQYTSTLLSTVEVRNGATLTLPANTTLRVANYAEIRVGTYAQVGNLVAEGTKEQPIHVGSLSGSTTNGWYGLYFRGDNAPPGASVLRNVTVAFSRDANVDVYWYNGLLLDNVTLDRSGEHASIVRHASPRFVNVVAHKPGWEAMYGYYASPTWIDSRVESPGRSGFYVEGCGATVLQNVTVDSANGYGFYSNNACAGAHFRGVSFLNATSRPWRNRIDLEHDVTLQDVRVLEVEYWGADLTTNRTLPIFTNGTGGANLTSVLLSGFEIRNGAILTLPPGTRLLAGNGAYVNVGTYAQRAGLMAEGTEADPIYLGSRSGSTTNGWYGLYFRGDGVATPGVSVLRNATIAFSRDANVESYAYSGLLLDNVTLDRSAQQGAIVNYASPRFVNVVADRPGWEAAYAHGSGLSWTGGKVDHPGRSGFYFSGCGVATLQDLVIDSAGSYGTYADGACNGAHLRNVSIVNATSRPWRNRVDLDHDVRLSDVRVHEVEYWGADLTSNRTLPIFTNGTGGANLTSVLLSGFEIRNAVWTLPPGTRLLADNGAYVNVGTYGAKASLVAEGTEAEPIYVGSRSGSTTNGWYGLYFRGDNAPLGESVLRNATIAFSRDMNVELYSYSGLLLDNVTLQGAAQRGLHATYSSPTLVNVSILDSGWEGVYYHSSAPSWRGGRIERSGRSGLYASGCGVATLEDLAVDGAGSYGFYADGACNGAHFRNVSFEDVANRAWRNRVDVAIEDVVVRNATVNQVEYWGADVVANRTLPLVTDEADGAPLPSALLSNVEVRNGAVWTIPAGSQVLGANGVIVQVGTYQQKGSLVVEGTQEDPVTMGSLSGSRTSGWRGLYFRGDGNAPVAETVLRNVTLTNSTEYGIHAYYYGGFRLDNATLADHARDGVRLYGNGAGSPTLQGVVAVRNLWNGAHVDGADLRVLQSNLSGNALNGLELRNTLPILVRDTTFHGNARAGVNVTYANANLDLRRSHLWSNGGFGVDMQGSTGSTIVDNAFIENVVGQARATGLHVWNVTKTEGRNVAFGPYLGGNSWSDYEGEDTDADGLGDTLVPYATNLGPGRDWLPVMGTLYADFNVSIPDLLNASRTLLFEDASRGGYSVPDQWVWDFGDGGQATTPTATHAFAADGTYPVQLTVANPHGQVSQVTKQVVVDSVAPLSAANVSGTPGLDGWIVSGVNVTLSATDDLAGIAEIRWRLDGGAWTTYATRIPVLADGAHALEFYALDRNGNVEPTRNVTFRIDRTLPVAHAVNLTGAPGLAGWFVSDVLAALSAEDATSGLARIEFGVDAPPATAYSAPVAFGQDGVFLLRWRAVDAAGNVGPERNATILRDATAPLVEGHESGPLGGAGWYLGNATVNLTAEDAPSGVVHLNASVDGGPWFPVNGSIVVTGDGVHTVDAMATDAAGNVRHETARTVRIDAETPVSNMTVTGTIGANGWYVSPVNVTLAASDAHSGVDVIVYSLDGGPNRTYDGPIHVNVSGQRAIDYYAVDLAGNVETVKRELVYLDLDAPTTRLNVTGTAGSNGWFLDNVTASITANETGNLAQILYALDGGPETEFLLPFPVAGEGVHHVVYHGVSVGGLVEENKTGLVRIDLTDPVLGFAANGTEGLAGWHVSPVSVALQPSDGASGIATTLVSVDGAAASTYVGPVTLSASGEHVVAGRTLDASGRNATGSLTVRVDVDDPLTTATLSPAVPEGLDGWHLAPVTLTLGATDVGSGVASLLVSVDGANETQYAGPITLGEGVHQVVFRAIDVAGRSETLRLLEVKVDLTPPVLDATLLGTEGNAGWFVSAVNASASALDATSGVVNLTRSVDGGAFAPGANATLSTTGVHTLAYRATDAAGLVGWLNLTIPLDVTPPVASASLSNAANGAGWRKESPTVTLSALDQAAGSGVDAIRFSLDGAPFANYTGPFVVGEGFHNLSLYAVDVAGLVQALGAPLPIRVDLTDPTGSVTLPAPDGPDGWHLSRINATLAGADAPSGLAGFSWWIDEGAPQTGTGVVQLASEGAHVLRARAVDLAERTSLLLEAPFKLDLNAPLTTPTLSASPTGTRGGVGWHARDSVNLTLSAVDHGAGVASVAYRVNDGPEQAYEGVVSFTEEGTHDVTFFATDLVGRVEALRALAPFGLDRTAPVTAALVEGSLDEDGVYKTVVNVTLAAADPLSGVTGIEYRVNDGSFQAYVGPIRFNASGNYTLEFRASDVAGNVEPLQALELSIFVDTSPPETTAVVDGPLGEGGWLGGNATVRLAATDVQSSVLALEARLDGVDLPQILGAAGNVSVAGEGVHLLEYRALDIASNKETFKALEIRIDLTPPALALDASYVPGRDGWIVSPVTLAPNATDALAGILRVNASIDGGPFGPVSDVLLDASGNHTVVAYAVDNAGLRSPLAAWSGKIDVDVPRLTPTLVGPQGLHGWFRENVSILLSPSQFDTSGLGPVQYRIDGGDWIAYPGRAFNFTDEGNHTLEAFVEDGAGNVGRLLPTNLGIDRTKPVIGHALDGAAGLAGWWVSPVTLATTVQDLPGVPGANVSGVHNLTRALNGEAVAADPTLLLDASGVHEVRDLALDAALNARDATLLVPIDLDDPELNVSLDGPAGTNGWFRGPVLVNATAIDATSGAGRVARDGGANVTGPILVEGDGVHRFALEAFDVAGRRTGEVPVEVRLDATPPEATSVLDGPRGANGWFTGVTSVTLDARDLVSGVKEIRYQLDGAPALVYNGTINLTKSGMHLISYTGIDLAGNVLHREVEVGLDLDAPEAEAEVAGVRTNSSWFRSGVVVTLNASDLTSGVSQIEYTFDLNASWIPYAGPFELEAEGNHTIWYRAIDASGRPSLIYSHHVLIDLTTPLGSIHLENTLYTEIDGKIYVSGDFCVSFTGFDALSGLRSLTLILSGAIEDVIEIDLSVSTMCFEEPEGEGWELTLTIVPCDVAEWCGGDDIGFSDDGGGGGGGGEGPYFVRPFRGGLNLQHVSLPVFSAAFPHDGIDYDTGAELEYTDPEDPENTRTLHGRVENPQHPLAQTTVVAGSRVPVWVAGYGFSPVKVDLLVDGRLVARATEPTLVRYEQVGVSLEATEAGEVTPALERRNVTRLLFAFDLDTLNLTAGKHTLVAKGYARSGKTLSGALTIDLLSPAAANATARAINETFARQVPGPLPGEVPGTVRQQVPYHVLPPLPPEVAERFYQYERAVRVIADLVDRLALDNYAYVDQHLLRFYEAYESASLVVQEATGRPDPVSYSETDWRVRAPGPDAFTGGNE